MAIRELFPGAGDMAGRLRFSLGLVSLVLILPCSPGLPLCRNSAAPISLNASLPFCNYTGSSCCSIAEDARISRQFRSLNLSDPCATVYKSILCAKCDPYASEIFPRSSTVDEIPLLCNSTSPGGKPFCEKAWEACDDASSKNSPFKEWKTGEEFCRTLGGPSVDESGCFGGEPVARNASHGSPPPDGVCLERLMNGSFINLVPHPDGSNRVFLSNLEGKIFLATVPEQGSNQTMEIDFDDPFLDLTDVVYSSSGFGLMGMAFHPQFVNNGRFFVSYNCDKSEGCSGRCSCNSELPCDPLKLDRETNSQPCQYFSVIAEYSAKSSSNATAANPNEVRRIFTMGLPFTSHHGGQILFGPSDGHLYFMMGDGGSNGDPWNFAQNRNAFLGKILRFDVDKMPSAEEIEALGAWGNYTVPDDNPFVRANLMRPEIFAIGFRNPWRCSFDSERPAYFFCGDVGQNAYEEVDLVTKGGNYGWRVYEGPSLYNPPASPGGNTSASSIVAIPPVMGYYHSEINPNTVSASVTGGYVYRGLADPCLYGRYIYADLYATAMWVGVESPPNSGKYNSSRIQFNCAADSPIACKSSDASNIPDLGVIFSFGEDNGKDVFLMANNGVQRVVSPSRCGYACSKEVIVPKKSPPSPSSGPRTLSPLSSFFLAVSLFLLLAFAL
ncbi:HIPL1 protein-like [Wolffia australiana]